MEVGQGEGGGGGPTQGWQGRSVLAVAREQNSVRRGW